MSRLTQRRNAFGERVRAYGLPNPKGALLLGVPGTLKDTVPLSTVSDQVEVLRRWARGRARPAAAPRKVDGRRRIMPGEPALA